MGDQMKLKDLLGLNQESLEAMFKKYLIAIISNSTTNDLTDHDPQNYIVEKINKKLIEMENNIVDKLLQENKKLNDLVEHVNEKLVNRVANLERSYWQSAQFQRRNNLEIAGILSNVSDRDLEEKVCDILCTIDVNVTPKYIEACSRLPYFRKEKKATKKYCKVYKQKKIVKLS